MECTFTLINGFNSIFQLTFWKVAKCEATIETYKKRLEEMGDLKGQIKYLEEKNTEYIQKNLDLEDELSNLNKKRPQVEVYKKQVVELNAKLSSEAERADRIAFDNSKLMEKLEALSVERDRWESELIPRESSYECCSCCR